MGNLRRAAQTRAASSRQSSFTPTQLGDPNFSYSATPDSQAQFPAAAAEYSFFQNQTTAQNRLADAAQAGFDINDPAYKELMTASQGGILQNAATLGETLIGWIDGPRQFVNLAIQDMAGGKAAAGQEDPGFLDYWDTFFGGMEDAEEFKLRTGLEPVSGSATLDMFGWDAVSEDAQGGEFFERVGRGVVDFGMQMVTDPLNYVTFGLSGLGKKVAMGAVRQFQSEAVETIVNQGIKKGLTGRQIADQIGDGGSQYMRGLAKQHDDLVEEMLEDLAKWEKGFGGEAGYVNRGATGEFKSNLPPDVEEAMNRYLGTTDPKALYENISELAIARKIGNDIMRPAVSRDFASIPAEVLEELPAYMRGGARISIPFAQSTLKHGVMIPGTRGLGKKLLGDPMRKLSGNLKQYSDVYKSLATKMDDGLDSFDMMRPLLKALGKPSSQGGIEPWQFHIAAPAIDSMHNQASKEIIIGQLNSKWKNIESIANDLGIEDLSEIQVRVLDRLEDSAFADELVEGLTASRLGIIKGPQPGSADAALRAAEDDMVNFISSTFEEYHSKLALLDPTIKDRYIKGYVPHVFGKAGRTVMQALSEAGGAIDEAMIREAEAANNPGKALLARVIAAQSQAGRLETFMGGSHYFNERGYGRLQALTLSNEGNLIQLDGDMLRNIKQNLLDQGTVNPDALTTKYIPVGTLNELLGPEIKALADELGVALPNDWDGNLFNQNPLELLEGYVSSLDEALGVWGMIDGLKTAGLAFKHSSALSVHDTLQSVMQKLMKNTEKVKKVKGGVPMAGEGTAPTSWLRKLASSENLNEVGANHGKPRFDNLKESMSKEGALKPVVVGISEDGQMFLQDGHHRLVAAEELGIGELPVKYEITTTPDFETGVNAREHLLPNVKYKPSMALEILDHPDDFVYHGTNRMTDDSLDAIMREEDAFTRGGLTSDRARAEAYSSEIRPAQAGSQIAPEGAQPRVLVFRKSDLPESAQRKLAKGEDVEELFENPELAFTGKPVRPVYSYTTEDGFMKGGVKADVASRQLNADEVFRTVPWQPQAVEESLILKGFDKSTTAAVPIEVLGTLRKEGLPADRLNIHTNKELLEMARMSQDEFLSMRPGGFTPNPMREPLEKGLAFSLRVADDVFDVRFRPTDSLEKAQEAIAEAMVQLDNMVRSGDVKFTPDAIREIMENPNTTEETAQFLYEYTTAKMGGLGDPVKEYFGKEAAEAINTRLLYNQFEKAINDFTRRVAAVQTPGGQLITDPSRMKQIGTDEILQDLQNIHDIARKLGDRGYDDIAKMMRDAEVYTSIATHKGFLNPGEFGLAGPAISDLQLQVGMGKFMRNFARNAALMYTPQGVAAAKMAANNTLRWWRAMATIARPTFHVRNLVGGSWMNMLMGVSDNSYRAVATNARKFREALSKPRPAGADVFEEALKELPAEVRPMFKAAWEEDILSGFVSTEFRKLTATEKKGRLNWLNVFDVDNFALTKFGGGAMQSIEDLLRMSLFAEYFDEAIPGSAKAARDMVNAVHFDYVNLTPLETKIKSWVPFFVWTRRNLPRQLQMAIENPRMIQKYRAMMQAMNDNFGGSEETLPDGDFFSAYAAGTNYYVNENTPFWGRVMIDPDLPIRDLLELPMPGGPELAEYANGLLGPHVSTLFDINQQRDFGDVNSPAAFAPIFQSLAAVGLYDETTSGDVRIPYWQRSVMETAFPFAREVGTPFMGGPTDPNRQQRLGIMPDDDPLTSALKSAGMTMAGGLGLKLTTPADARSVAARSNMSMDEIVEQLRFEGLLPASSG